MAFVLRKGQNGCRRRWVRAKFVARVGEEWARVSCGGEELDLRWACIRRIRLVSGFDPAP